MAYLLLMRFISFDSGWSFWNQRIERR